MGWGWVGEGGEAPQQPRADPVPMQHPAQMLAGHSKGAGRFRQAAGRFIRRIDLAAVNVDLDGSDHGGCFHGSLRRAFRTAFRINLERSVSSDLTIEFMASMTSIGKKTSTGFFLLGWGCFAAGMPKSINDVYKDNKKL